MKFTINPKFTLFIIEFFFKIEFINKCISFQPNKFTYKQTNRDDYKCHRKNLLRHTSPQVEFLNMNISNRNGKQLVAIQRRASVA